MRSRNLIESFNYAVDGIVYVLKTQRNMKIHFLIAAIILISSLFLDFSRLEFIVLLFTISFVIVAELINTAIESTIDVVTSTFDPIAMIAKDVAAGAVLLASINAVVIGYLLFFNRLSSSTFVVLQKVQRSPVHITFIALLLVVILAVVGKVITGKGTPFHGGLPSGHSALAFAVFTSITFIAYQFATPRVTAFISTLALFMAFLVLQSRIETGIHSFFEVFIGAILGLVVTTLIWQAYFLYIR